MSKELTSITIAQMAKQLFHMRKNNGLKTALVLGTRAGGLFRSPILHQTLQPFLPQKAPNPPDMYEQYYQLLCHQSSPFSATEIQVMLSGALSTVLPDEADKCLAALIMQGYFDPIITTNADSLLEQALASAGWRDSHEFQVINLIAEPAIPSFPIGNSTACTIIKVFGELRMRNYLLSGRYAYLNIHEHQSHVLTRMLRRDCLLIGIDETWDATLLQILPAQGDSCWIAVEEEPDRRSYLSALQAIRNTSFFIDHTHARYAPYMLALHRALTEISAAPSPHPETPSSLQQASAITTQSLPLNTPYGPAPLEVFISYHPKDEAFLHKLENHLSVLKHEHLITSWFRSNILAGQKTAAEVQRHLNSASMILLLVSDDFIASKDIYLGEVQQAMTRQQQGQAYVIPLLIRPVDWRTTVFGELEPLPSNHRFVTQWRDVDSAFLDIVQGIKSIITLITT